MIALEFVFHYSLITIPTSTLLIFDKLYAYVKHILTHYFHMSEYRNQAVPFEHARPNICE